MIVSNVAVSRLLMSVFMFCLPLAVSLGSQAKPYVPLSFAISGGISLGSYEAGLNWAIVKYSKIVRRKPSLSANKKPPKLMAVTGASAGGINALVTAISWCIDEEKYNQKHLKNNQLPFDSIGRNLFKDIWMDVGFDSLLPKDTKKYLPDDALFTRNAFNNVIQNIKDILNEDVFIENCTVPVAVTTTRTTPLTQEVIEGIKVQNQRFVVPFILATAKDGSKRLNILPYEKDNKKFGNTLHLPYVSAKQKTLVVQDVIDAVLASSAFPVAFGRKKLSYCLHNESINDKNKLKPNDLCPAGSSLLEDEFVDGGVFDNVPLGLAKLLSGDDDSHQQIYNYIYLDPSSRRLGKNEIPRDLDKDKKQNKSFAYGLSSQLSFLSGAIATAESYELYNILRSGDWEKDQPRKIILSSRYPAITGKYLGHFGAFLDDGFRRYDYYAGIYDAVHDLAKYRCRAEVLRPAQYNNCLGYSGKIIYDELKISSDANAAEIFSILARGEHEKNAADISWSWAYNQKSSTKKTGQVSNAVLVAKQLVLLRTKYGEEAEFSTFILAIADDYNLQGASEEIRRIIRNKNASSGTWFYPLASRISLRLFNLEKNDESSSYEGLLGMTAFGIESVLGDKKRFEWNQSTALNSNYRFIPYEIAAGIGSTGMNLAWESRYQLSDNNAWNFRMKFSPAASLTTDVERVWFAQLDSSISYAYNSMIMLGGGPTISRSYDQFVDFEQTVSGASVYVSLTDKLRFTYGKRSFGGDFAGGDTYFYISITDLPGFVYWIKQTF